MKNKMIYVLIFLLGSLVAATGTKIYFDSRPSEEVTKLNEKKPRKKGFFESFFGDDDFFEEEVFDQMEEMMKQFGKMGPGIMPGAPVGDAQLNQYEDDRYLYIEFRLGQIDKNSINLNIKDGMITIKGQTKIEKTKQNQYGQSTSISISSFHKTFPVPEGVKEEEVIVDHKDGAIVLKFPKRAKI